MRFQEAETVALKSIVMDDIKKESIAFANCTGGTVYVGVADDGAVLGVENTTPKAVEAPKEIENTAAPILDPYKEKLLQFLTEHQVITHKEVQTLLNVSPRLAEF